MPPRTDDPDGTLVKITLADLEAVADPALQAAVAQQMLEHLAGIRKRLIAADGLDLFAAFVRNRRS